MSGMIQVSILSPLGNVSGMTLQRSLELQSILLDMLCRLLTLATCIDIMQALLKYTDHMCTSAKIQLTFDLAQNLFFDNLLACSQTPSIIALSWERFLQHLSNKNVLIDDEIDLFTAVMHWIGINPSDLITHVVIVVSTVIRLPQFSTHFLSHTVLSHPLLQTLASLVFKTVCLYSFQFHVGSESAQEQSIYTEQEEVFSVACLHRVVPPAKFPLKCPIKLMLHTGRHCLKRCREKLACLEEEPGLQWPFMLWDWSFFRSNN